ncbi:MAG: GNAT family N-acetyltransferase, partial [Planctomycetales bacterium]|nr:GNAT family N-acetyltransferase [Planctomycetales bacterium]
MIYYRQSLEGVQPTHLVGFFDGWPNAPSPNTHLQILRGSSEVVLALDSETPQVVGYVTAITDGVLSAYIPLLEVLPTHRRRGIGSELLHQMLLRLDRLYMIDLVCDCDLKDFYKRVGMIEQSAMSLRNRQNQAG